MTYGHSLHFYWMLELGGPEVHETSPGILGMTTLIKRIISAKVIDENKSSKTVCNLILFVILTNCYPNCISFYSTS
jgi:hypothetical protein